MTLSKTTFPLMALLALSPIWPSAPWAQEAGAETATALPEMADIEQAWAQGNFVFARQGLKRRAEETGAALAQYRYGRVLLEGRGGPTDREAARLWLEKAAAQTHVEASVLLARIYLSAPEGDPVSQPARAARLFKSAAARGNSEAQYYLGLLYRSGVGVTAHPEEAFTWLLAASENGHIEAQFELSRAYARGEGIAEDAKQALRWMQEAADAGHGEAQFFLAYALDRGQGVEQNRRAAVDWLLRSAETGFGQAQLALGRKYLTGDGVAARPAEAQRWLEAAAAQGSAAAATVLGTALRGAHGVPADPALAVRWLKAASDAGVAEASFTLGQIREAGDAAAPDLQDAVVLYRLAVDQGSAVAEQHLGSLAATGALDGLLAPHRAIPWVVAAAEAGNPAAADWLSQQAAAGLRPAQTAFGLWLLTQEDRSGEISVQAADQFQAAAETGDVEAQHNLGRLYIQGQGVDQDYVMAHKWFNIAAAGGHRDALKMRGVVADLMTPEQVAKAQTAARGFVERPPAALSEETSEGISQ